MKEDCFAPMHNRIVGVVKLIEKTLLDEWKIMSPSEVNRLNYIQSRLDEIVGDDQPGCETEDDDKNHAEPLRCSRQFLNTQCEFFDVDANRIQCAVGCSMFDCSKRCRYATNIPGSVLPYGTKYMKGRLV